jgi:hypothetical protein
MEAWRVRCECGAEHTEIYPDGLDGDQSLSDFEDPKRCDCEEPQYEPIERVV